MVLKCSTVCLVALALFGSFCQAQLYGQKPSAPQKNPPQFQQEKQTFEQPIAWKYPDGPTPEVIPEGPFEQRTPVSAATVAVDCREREAIVEVQKDIFAIGQFINPAHLSLGNCAYTSEDSQVVTFDVQLHDCGSQLSTTDSSLIYTFILNYNPRPIGTSPVVRTNSAAVIVECHYPRKHNVSSLALEPVWVPYYSAKVAQEYLYFSLTLMTEDWLYARSNYQFYLGEIIYIEASVHQYFHAPLRIFVDQCVATTSSDVNSQPNYAIISNGCLVDARLTGSSSKFFPRVADNKLRFQVDAFRFENPNSGTIYITCNLRAALASTPIDSDHRACSFNNGWSEVDGYNSVCSSCEPVGVPFPMNPGAGGSGKPTGTTGATGGTGGMSSTIWGTSSNPSGNRKVREATKTEVFEWQGEVALGPFQIREVIA